MRARNWLIAALLLIPCIAVLSVGSYNRVDPRWVGIPFFYLLPQTYAIHLQLLGGVWVIQTLPAVWGALWKSGLTAFGLLAGWATGMATGTWLAVTTGFAPVYPLQLGSLTVPCYTAVLALAVNALVVAGFSLAPARRSTSTPFH